MTNKYYLNFYQCSCGLDWEYKWDSMCDDRCPNCHTSISPFKSTETGLCLALHAAVDLYDACWHEACGQDDSDTPDRCNRWANECRTIATAYPDFPDVQVLQDLAEAFNSLAERLRAKSYGD